MAPGRTKKWDTTMKADFAKKIKQCIINPEHVGDIKYIKDIRQHYYPDQPAGTFCNNFMAPVQEWRIGQGINKYNKGKSSSRNMAMHD